MDRDPQDTTDDFATLDSLISALLDPEHFWKLDEASGATAVDSGYGAKNLTISGAAPVAGLPFVTRGYRFDGVNDALTSGTLPASTTTFTILAWLRQLQGHTNDEGQILSGTGGGFVFSHVTKGPYFAPGSGYDFAADMPALDLRQISLVAVVATAGTARYGLNGVMYDGGGGTNPIITSFTPNNVGGSAGAFLRADLAKVVYLPGVAITDTEFATIYAARFPCHTASLAVVNQALAHIGESHALTSLSTDTTARGVQARLHYPTAVDTALRDFAWPFANRYATLTLVGGTAATVANSDWQYSYRAPDRMIRALRIVQPGMKRQHDPNPPPWEKGQDDLGELIFTDQEDAELQYTIRPVCPALQGDSLFRTALSWYLAALFVPTLSKNEKTQADCFSIYGAMIGMAITAAANEDEPQNTNQNDPDWITGR